MIKRYCLDIFKYCLDSEKLFKIGYVMSEGSTKQKSTDKKQDR